MLTVAKLQDIMDGLAPDARVIVGIIEGERYDAADARQEVTGEGLSLYILCYEEPREWEGGGPEPIINEDGTGTLRYDPDAGPEGGA